MRVLVNEPHKLVKIDLVDRKILFMLAQNAHFSYSTISKHVKLSREAVKQRVVRLQKQKVILGFQAVIDVSQLDYSTYHIFAQLNNPTTIIEENFVKELTNDSSVNALLKYTGVFDFEISYMMKDINTLNEKLKELSSKDIKKYVVYTLLKTIVSKSYPKCMYDFSLEIKNVGSDGSFFSNFQKKKTPAKFDEIDYKLLTIIADDARINMVELARKLDVSVDTAIYRVKKLISAKVIMDFRPIINYAAFGYSVYCLFFKFRNFTKEKESAFNLYLKENENILWSANCLGDFNNISYLLAKNTFQFHDVLHEIRGKFHDILDSFDYLLSFAEYKYTYFPEGVRINRAMKYKNYDKK
ncbi:MAG: winged helix-turn-helix transcriptional regulator [Nanoarchaeota archaeon]|nr:AsnC family transcriptional regulator [Nanoarchaeota archaeon]MBU1631781.1 AsnC family transcriptional regulator [Nanoarchaeota archaeon]MBU1876290.1 AsnC family transcriptional regulator [Nanoarchaeota archaeon]